MKTQNQVIKCKMKLKSKRQQSNDKGPLHNRVASQGAGPELADFGNLVRR